MHQQSRDNKYRLEGCKLFERSPEHSGYVFIAVVPQSVANRGAGAAATYFHSREDRA